MIAIQSLHTQHSQALHDADNAKSAYETAQAAYDAKLAEIMSHNSELKALHDQLESAKDLHDSKKTTLVTYRDSVKDALEGDKIDDLPPGYTQTREKIVTYDEQELLHACINHAPFLLTVDTKRVEQFATSMATEDKGSAIFALPEHIKAWLPIKLETKYKARISDTTLQKIKIVIVTEEKAEAQIPEPAPVPEQVIEPVSIAAPSTQIPDDVPF